MVYTQMIEKDIQFLLSGGLQNKNPLLSIGGEPSRTKITKTLNNLFDDVTNQQANSGSIDYRCLYIKLISTNEKLINTSVFLRKEASIGANIKLGLSITNEVQVLTIAGNPVGGSFRLSFEEKSSQGTTTSQTRTILWIPDVVIMSQRITALINSLGNLNGVTCVGQQTSTNYDFVITFAGMASGRAQELLTVIDDQGLNVIVSRIQSGGPINRIAPNIGDVNNPPNQVTFVPSARKEPIEIGTILPGDFLAVWIKREVIPGIKTVHPDNFGLKIMGKPAGLNSNALFQQKD